MDKFIPTAKPDEVLVELVCDRSPKDDCRGNTGIIWAGQGDVQPYPRAKWPLLVVHPDVWRLYQDTRSTLTEEDQAAALRIATEKAEVDRLAAEKQADEERAENERLKAEVAEQQRAAVEAEKAEADRVARENELLGRDTDSVTATIGDKSNPDAGAGGGGGDTGGAGAEGAGESDGGQPDEAPNAGPTKITSEDLAAWKDEEVRAEAQRHGIKLHPRLKPENLRTQFLEAYNELIEHAQAAKQSKET